MFFLVKILDPTINRSIFIFTQPQIISVKNKYPPLAENFTKRYLHKVVIPLLYRFCVKSLILVDIIFVQLSIPTMIVFKTNSCNNAAAVQHDGLCRRAMSVYSVYFYCSWNRFHDPACLPYLVVTTRVSVSSFSSALSTAGSILSISCS